MTHSGKRLADIYRLYVDSGGKPLAAVERYLGATLVSPISEGLRRNERQVYKAFIEKDPGSLDDFFRNMLQDLRASSFANGTDTIAALDFIQRVVATAMWKHNLSVSASLAAFAREFDRLDILSERERLYLFAQDDHWPTSV